MALLDQGSGGSSNDPETSDDGNGYTVTTDHGTTSAGDDTPEISLGDSNPGSGQRFDGTAAAEQPDTPETRGETVIVGGTPDQRQDVRDEVYENVSDRASEAENNSNNKEKQKAQDTKEKAKQTAGWMEENSDLVIAVSAVLGVAAAAKSTVFD